MSNPASHPPPSAPLTDRFVSRAGHKLLAALEAFQINPAGLVCADLGANVGGFTDCLLQHNAKKVYSVDTAYGVFAWTLRKDPRVILRERTNALHVTFPEPIDLIAIDLGWTRQEKILPHAASLLRPAGHAITLIKPHYQSDLAKKSRGVLTLDQSQTVLDEVLENIRQMQTAGTPTWQIKGIIKSPIEGQKGNTEFLACLRPSAALVSEHP